MTNFCMHLQGKPAVWAAALLFAGVGMVGMAQGQTMYRIIGADGRVTFTDKPPAATENATPTAAGGRPLSGGSSNSLPFELRQVAGKFPVTLYSSANCGPCASGRTLLGSRGIPYNERLVETAEDSEALQRISGESSLPFLTIGGQQIKGYSESEWTPFLDAAGYPKTSQLPSSYRQPPATPLVAMQKPTAAPTTSAPAEDTTGAQRKPVPRPAPPPPPANPAGITF